MITERENRALQLAKKVFEHFTHDALPIAREILAMESELGQSTVNGKQVNGKEKSKSEVKKTNGQATKEPLNDFPVSDLSIKEDPSIPCRRPDEEKGYTPEDDLPF